MKPEQITYELRQIATALENSKSPRQDLVLQDLKRIAIMLEEVAVSEEPEEESGPETKPCDKCGQETPIRELSGFGPEGSVCDNCKMKLQRKYRGKRMDYGV